MTTLEDAQAVIDRMKSARPTCDKDETIPFYASLREPDGPPGFEPDPNFAGYRKRCDACANGRLFPWADKLDPERVRAFMETDPRCQSAFELSILEETISPYVLAVDQKLKTIEQSMELYLLSMDLYGVPPASIASIAPPVPQQTYACAKCGELHCTRNHPEFT